MNISIVIPVYNSEATLKELVTRLQEVLKRIATKYELIFVNDGGADRSWDQICELTAKNRWIKGIKLIRNYGQHNALLCGIRAARYELIVTMDDDLQNPPEDIPRLIEKIDEGHDVVYGTPEKQRHGFWRDSASQITKLTLQNLMGAEVAKSVSAFRAFRTILREAFADYKAPFVSIDVLLSWGTNRFSKVEVNHDYRKIGKSNYTFQMLITHAFNMITGFSVLPLQMASIIGLASSVFGLFLLIYVVGNYLFGQATVPGFTFLASMIAIFSGTLLLTVGVIGEYLSRLFFRSIDKPAYTIREQIRSD